MGNQTDIFLGSEGDAWFERNFWKMEDQKDASPVVEMVKKHVRQGFSGNILEFGCSNGITLNALREEYPRSNLYGVDPSDAAIQNGRSRFHTIHFAKGTTIAHPYPPSSMGMVIYGFCLYVCDPPELPEIVCQGDNLLRDRGYLIIHDFDAHEPHSVPNHHVEGLMTYKMNWGQLWLANPAYKLIEQKNYMDGTSVWILQKRQEEAFPCLVGSPAA